MKSISKNNGMTLIEVLMYVALLSMLLSGFIQSAYAMHFADLSLTDDIHDAEHL